MVQNKGLIFKEVPTGLPVAGKNLTIEDRPFDIEQSPPPGGLITKNLYASFDPYQRGRMRAPDVKSYAAPAPLGEPLGAGVVAKVLKSDHPNFKVGDEIVGGLAIEEYTIVSKEMAGGLKKIDNPYNLDLKLFIGALGMPGLTAYSSFYDIGKPVKGETIFISAASGAVGQIVGQLAKHEGLTVIGSVGSDEKLEFILKGLNFDSGFNYKKEKPIEALKRLAPNGIDIYYENVGGEQLEASITHMNSHGRIVACGMVSQYNLTPEKMYPIRNMFQFVAKRITMRGFIVSDADMGPKYVKQRDEFVAKWLHEGSLIAKTSVTDGIDNAATGWLDMIEGRSLGKSLLRIAEP